MLRNAFEDDTACLENGAFTASALGGYLADDAWQLPADGTGPCESLMRTPARPWPGNGAAWVWTGLRAPVSQQAMAERLRELCRNSFEPDSQTEPYDATPEMVEALRQGADLLTSLLPQIGPSVLRHVSLIGFSDGESADGPLQSLSGGDPLPSAILMSPGLLRRPLDDGRDVAARGRAPETVRRAALLLAGGGRYGPSADPLAAVLLELHQGAGGPALLRAHDGLPIRSPRGSS